MSSFVFSCTAPPSALHPHPQNRNPAAAIGPTCAWGGLLGEQRAHSPPATLQLPTLGQPVWSPQPLPLRDQLQGLGSSPAAPAPVDMPAPSRIEDSGKGSRSHTLAKSPALVSSESRAGGRNTALLQHFQPPACPRGPAGSLAEPGSHPHHTWQPAGTQAPSWWGWRPVAGAGWPRCGCGWGPHGCGPF